jgi:hypothetical protein
MGPLVPLIEWHILSLLKIISQGDIFETDSRPEAARLRGRPASPRNLLRNNAKQLLGLTVVAGKTKGIYPLGPRPIHSGVFYEEQMQQHSINAPLPKAAILNIAPTELIEGHLKPWCG